MTDFQKTTRRPDITITSFGRIDITVRVARLLGLQPGDVVSLLPRAGELYLIRKLPAGQVVGRHRGQCAYSSRSKGSLRTWSVAMAQTIFDAGRPAHGDLQILRLPCGDPEQIDGFTAVPIITQINITSK